jgi:hypothetical protein
VVAASYASSLSTSDQYCLHLDRCPEIDLMLEAPCGIRGSKMLEDSFDFYRQIHLEKQWEDLSDVPRVEMAELVSEL